MMERIKTLLQELFADDDDDLLEDEMVDDIGISGPVLTHGEFGDRLWYVTATYGTGPDHDHIELKLDEERFRQLYKSMIDAMARYAASGPQVRGEPASDLPTPPESASPPPAPQA